MQYRTVSPEENGFDNEHEAYTALRHHIQLLMQNSGPNELLDSILVVINICESRSLLNRSNKSVADWNDKVALFLRSALDQLAPDADGHCPSATLEDPLLYFPDLETTQ